MTSNERKVTIPGPDGRPVQGTDMVIEDSNEKMSEMKLHDGTVIRYKTVVTQVIRIDGAHDAEGNPVYVVKSAPAITILSAPDYLKKGGIR
jgi:hypothetical protein